MVACLASRGPDAEALLSLDGAVLGHRRLAILDLDTRANQPFVGRSGRYTIVYNGEIYNFRELRTDLEAEGIAFRTTSDTEVLLELYAREGERMLPRLRGMFAFAIWDRESRSLFLARDPYGIKPLYYARTRAGFVFASQVKALIASGLVPAVPEPAGQAGFYLWGSVPEPWTMYRDVFALPAGHWMRVRPEGAPVPVAWHDIAQHFRGTGSKLPDAQLQEHVRTVMADSVRAHLVADVPACVFLSGGIDSSAVAALAAETGAHIEGITLKFEEFSGRAEDEVPDAARVASHYDLPHYVRTVTREEFLAEEPRILAAMDQPSIDGVNTYFASKAAAERGYKVVLSGVGGDELFCGYGSFTRIPRAAALGRAVAAVPGATPLLRLPLAWIGRRRAQPKLAHLPELAGSIEGLYQLVRGLFMPSDLPRIMGAEAAREGLERLGSHLAGTTRGARDGVAAVGILEATQYMRNQLLRDSDWASMAHSLELRTPLVDARVLAQLAPYFTQFVNGAGKRMLGCSPRVPLPDDILNRTKTGFTLPMNQWMAARAGAPWARGWARHVGETYYDSSASAPGATGAHVLTRTGVTEVA
jgi:asparagine synthase (glutamine-hydrolysing)